MQNKKILIVDDSAANVQIIQEILCADYALRTASTGEEALEIVPEFKPDIILLDIMMPGINGYEVCQKIRQDKNFCYIKIILVSAKAMIEERLRGYEVGADDYMTKPFDEEELLAKVKVYLKLKYTEEVDILKNNLLQQFSKKDKSPLQHILGFANLLKNDESLSADARENVKMIMEECIQLWRSARKTQLMCDLKSQNKLSLELFQIVDLIHDSIEDLKSKTSSKNISFIFDEQYNEEIPLDENLLRKALIFLLDSALDASPSNKTITISTEVQEGKYLINVHDEGHPVDDALKSIIFDELTGPNEIPIEKRGGLNLPIVQKIAHLHHGGLDLRNDDSGVTITLELGMADLLSLAAK